MKKNIALFITFICIFMVTTTANVVSQERAWAVGDRVMANWSADQYWYPGTIIEIKGNQYYIQFDDGDREWLPAGVLKPENLKKGDVVYGNWLLQGTYYKGKIAERRGNAIWIHYDDGDKEWTTIMAVRVLY